MTKTKIPNRFRVILELCKRRNDALGTKDEQAFIRKTAEALNILEEFGTRVEILKDDQNRITHVIFDGVKKMEVKK